MQKLYDIESLDAEGQLNEYREIYAELLTNVREYLDELLHLSAGSSHRAELMAIQKRLDSLGAAQ